MPNWLLWLNISLVFNLFWINLTCLHESSEFYYFLQHRELLARNPSSIQSKCNFGEESRVDSKYQIKAKKTAFGIRRPRLLSRLRHEKANAANRNNHKQWYLVFLLNTFKWNY